MEILPTEGDARVLAQNNRWLGGLSKGFSSIALFLIQAVAPTLALILEHYILNALSLLQEQPWLTLPRPDVRGMSQRDRRHCDLASWHPEHPEPHWSARCGGGLGFPDPLPARDGRLP
jgi:hypothetical protein